MSKMYDRVEIVFHGTFVVVNFVDEDEGCELTYHKYFEMMSGRPTYVGMREYCLGR